MSYNSKIIPIKIATYSQNYVGILGSSLKVRLIGSGRGSICPHKI